MARRKVVARVTYRIHLEVDEDVQMVEETVIQNLDRVIADTSGKAEVCDTEMVDWDVIHDSARKDDGK